MEVLNLLSNIIQDMFSLEIMWIEECSQLKLSYYCMHSRSNHKINFPNNIFMIRGNHECRSLSQHFNFQKECIAKYNNTFHDAIQNSFDNLPLACIINKSILCIHGGISQQLVT